MYLDSSVDTVYLTVMYTKEDYIWAAGFMDGEGTIGIRRGHRDGRIQYRPQVRCAQSRGPHTYEAIEKLHKMFGGYTAMTKSIPPRTDVFSWSACNRIAYEAVLKLRPYLLVKRDNADTVIEYYKNIVNSKGGSKKATLPESEQKRREGLWIKSRSLNMKGALRLQRLNEGGT